MTEETRKEGREPTEEQLLEAYRKKTEGEMAELRGTVQRRESQLKSVLLNQALAEVKDDYRVPTSLLSELFSDRFGLAEDGKGGLGLAGLDDEGRPLRNSWGGVKAFDDVLAEFVEERADSQDFFRGANEEVAPGITRLSPGRQSRQQRLQEEYEQARANGDGSRMVAVTGELHGLRQKQQNTAAARVSTEQQIKKLQKQFASADPMARVTIGRKIAELQASQRRTP